MACGYDPNQMNETELQWWLEVMEDRALAAKTFRLLQKKYGHKEARQAHQFYVQKVKANVTEAIT